MLTIRKDQVLTLEQQALNRYARELVVHLQGFAPRLSELRGEKCMRQVVRTGIERAFRHGFTNRGPLRLYIELMVSLGIGFDTDPQYAWARDAIDAMAEPDQMARAALLYRRASDYFDAVMGPDNRHAIAALERITAAGAEGLMPDEGETARADAACVMRSIYPEKMAFIGEVGSGRLFESACDAATRYGLRSARGRALLLGLQFGFGHAVTEDPLYPWVADALDAAHIPDPVTREQRLRGRTMAYVAGILKHFSDPA